MCCTPDPPTPDTRCSQKLWKVGVGRCPWAGGRGGPRAEPTLRQALGRLRFPQRSPVALRPSARVPGSATPGPALRTKSHPPASGCAGSRPRCHLGSSHPWGRARGLSFSELKGLRPGSPERGQRRAQGRSRASSLPCSPEGRGQGSGAGNWRPPHPCRASRKSGAHWLRSLRPAPLCPDPAPQEEAPPRPEPTPAGTLLPYCHLHPDCCPSHTCRCRPLPPPQAERICRLHSPPAG